MAELVGLQGFDTEKLRVKVFVSLHCENCYAPFSIHLETGVYTHPRTECLLNDKKYVTPIDSHGFISVKEVL